MAYNPPPYGYPPASNSGGGGSYGDPETVQHGTGQGYVASDPYSQQYGRVDSVAGNDPTAKNIPVGAGGSGGYNFKPGTEAMIVEDRERFNYAQSQYRDFPFVIAFAIHFVLFLVITGYYGSRMSYNTTSTTNTTAFDAGKTISILVVAAVVSVCWSAMFFELMKRYANKIIYFMLVVNAVLCFVGMILAFYSHAYGAGVGYLIIFIFACLMFYCWRHRIPFAHAVLHASALSIQRYSGPIYTAYLLAVISIGWFALWAFTVASVYYQGSANNGNNGLTAGQQLILIYLLFSFYWTSQVLKNVGHTTTAGVVATFYFQPQTDSATWPALKRTVTTSFGSVCLGSLLVALLEMLVYACRSAKGRASRDGNVGLYILACLAECILAQLEAWLRYFNSYAYCQVAIYGVKFMDAAQATIDLFKGRLFDAIINDDLTGLVLSLGCITAGGAACIIAIIWGSIANFDLWSSVAVLAFIVGYAIAMLFFTVIGSAVKTTFVCWAMDPQIFQQNHPELFQNLMVASQAAGYNVQINVNARPGAGQV